MIKAVIPSFRVSERLRNDGDFGGGEEEDDGCAAGAGGGAGGGAASAVTILTAGVLGGASLDGFRIPQHPTRSGERKWCALPRTPSKMSCSDGGRKPVSILKLTCGIPEAVPLACTKTWRQLNLVS